jgi:hypothetical protein
VEVTGVLGLGRRDVDDGPNVDLAVVIAHEHSEELEHVDTVGLEAAVPALDVDRGRVDDEVAAVGPRLEEAMEPEAVATGLIAGDERDGGVEREATPRCGDLSVEDLEVAGRDGADARLLAETRAEGELPGAIGEFEGEV